MLLLTGRAAALDDDTQRIRRPDRRVRNIRRNEKCFPLAHEMIHDPIAFADAHFDVALELVEIFFGIDQMKIVPCVWSGDHHHEKITAIVEITVADRRLEQMPVLFDPVGEIDRRLNFRRRAGF